MSDDTPPGADAMERARLLILELNRGWSSGDEDADLIPTARAIEQAQREARAAAIEEAVTQFLQNIAVAAIRALAEP